MFFVTILHMQRFAQEHADVRPGRDTKTILGGGQPSAIGNREKSGEVWPSHTPV